MREKIWTDRFSLNKEELATLCPKCQTSKLSLVELKELITAYGKELEQYRYPYGIEYFFAGLLKCNNCKQLITISGIVNKNIESSGYDAEGEYYENYFDHYIPKFYYPNLRYFKITDQIPQEIIKVIDLAFQHYFNDLNASANKIRTIIELILDDVKAPTGRRNKKGSKIIRFKNLHARIENYARRNKNLSILMLANKYIGNNGSHRGEVTKAEVLDAFDNLEEIVDRVYIKKQQTLITKANHFVNKRKSTNRKSE